MAPGARPGPPAPIRRDGGTVGRWDGGTIFGTRRLRSTKIEG